MRKIATAAFCSVALLNAQEPIVEPVRPAAVVLVRPYLSPRVPPVRLANSGRLGNLVRAGMLYLTVQDAIALALENNIDIEVARYNPILSEWQLERSQAGGALPGVPSSAAQAGNVANGQGVAGSQAAAGVSTGSSANAAAASTNATIAQIGPIAQTLDPVIQENTVFSHQTAPQADTVQSILPVLVSNTRNSSFSYAQGFLIGGNVTVSYKDSYLNENAPTDVLNPSSAPSLSITYQQNLLRGFGVPVNSRTIRVSRLNVKASELNFKAQVSTTVNQVLNLYYALSASYEDIKAKSNAIEVAQKFYDNSKLQEQAGTLARLDVTTAEAQLASAQYDLVNSQTNLQQQQLQLKNLLSRNGVASPQLAEAHIIPTDHVTVPEVEQVQPFQDLVAQAFDNRPDLGQSRVQVENSKINLTGVRNAMLPQLNVVGDLRNTALAGSENTLPNPATGLVSPSAADPFFVGGYSDILRQIFGRNFPNYSIGVQLTVTLRNRSAQADMATAQLTYRQTELQLQKAINQIRVDVQTALTALQQARAAHQAALRAVDLQTQTLDAEQQKLALGASTPYNVILIQRDLATAQQSLVTALAAYAFARIQLDQSVGATLERNGIQIEEAKSGHVSRAPDRIPEANGALTAPNTNAAAGR